MNDVLFQIKSKYDINTYLRLAEIDYRLHTNTPTVLMYIVALACGIALDFAIISFPSAAVTWTVRFLVVVVLVLLVKPFKKSSGRKLCAKLAKRAWEHQNNSGDITVTFRADSFTASEEGSEISLKYSVISELVEAPDAFFVFRGGSACYVLLKSDFSTGKPAAFRNFIKEATDKRMPGCIYIYYKAGNALRK